MIAVAAATGALEDREVNAFVQSDALASARVAYVVAQADPRQQCLVAVDAVQSVHHSLCSLQSTLCPDGTAASLPVGCGRVDGGVYHKETTEEEVHFLSLTHSSHATITRSQHLRSLGVVVATGSLT